jgi:hypothetical protein
LTPSPPSFLHRLQPVLASPSLPCAQYAAWKRRRFACDPGPQHVGFQQALHCSHIAPRRRPHAALCALAPGDWRAECTLQATARPAVTAVPRHQQASDREKIKRPTCTRTCAQNRRCKQADAYAHGHTSPEAKTGRGAHRKTLRHLHQGKNEFLRGANAIERRQCTRLALPSLAALALFPCPLPSMLVPRLMHGQLSKTPPALDSRRRTSRPQPLGLLSSRPPFSSSPAPVGHGRACVGCEQAQ